METAEGLRSKLEQLSLPWNNEHFRSTISIGVVVDKNEGRNLEELIRRADKALYNSKGKGGNKVV